MQHNPQRIIKHTLDNLPTTKPKPTITGNSIHWINKNNKKSMTLTIPLTPLDFSSITLTELSHSRVYNQPSFNTIKSLLSWLQSPDSILSLKSIL